MVCAMEKQYIIGIDQGTTNIKAGLFDIEGNLYTQAEFKFSVHRPEPGVVEQDPDEWWGGLLEVLRGVLQPNPGARVEALGICSQVNSHIFADQAGAALLPAVLWQDQRAAGFVDGLNERVAQNAHLFPPGYAIDVTALLARAEWARMAQPALWKKTAYIFSPKDYLNMRLTGGAASDCLGSIGLVDEAGAYMEGLEKVVPGIAKRLPTLVEFRQPVGKIVPFGDSLLDGALEGAVVAEGTMDAFGNLYGSGAVSHGDSIEVSGTCEIVGALSKDSYPAPGVVTFPRVDGLYLHSGPTKSGGASLQWICQCLQKTVGEVVELAGQAPPGCDGLVFLPYLEGERAPLWDADARGVFFGLNGAHSATHLCRAVLEGVAFSARHLAEEIDKAAGFRMENLRISGGSSQSGLCCQIRADILNRNIERIHVRHSGMLGAALMASVASGLIPDMKSAAEKLVHIEKTFTPQARLRALYDAQYDIYRNVYTHLLPDFERLKALPKIPLVLCGRSE